jgi:hypothetical protein
MLFHRTFSPSLTVQLRVRPFRCSTKPTLGLVQRCLAAKKERAAVKQQRKLSQLPAD